MTCVSCIRLGRRVIPVVLILLDAYSKAEVKKTVPPDGNPTGNVAIERADSEETSTCIVSPSSAVANIDQGSLSDTCKWDRT